MTISLPENADNINAISVQMMDAQGKSLFVHVAIEQTAREDTGGLISTAGCIRHEMLETTRSNARCSDESTNVE